MMDSKQENKIPISLIIIMVIVILVPIYGYRALNEASNTVDYGSSSNVSVIQRDYGMTLMCDDPVPMNTAQNPNDMNASQYEDTVDYQYNSSGYCHNISKGTPGVYSLRATKDNGDIVKIRIIVQNRRKGFKVFQRADSSPNEWEVMRKA
jgi:hypothetical protein